MSVLKRGLCVLAAGGAAIAAHASVNYSNITATVTFDGATTDNLNVIQGSNSLDFSASGTPMTVGDGSGHTTAVVNISYDANSSSGLNGMDLLFTGGATGTGEVNFDEKVFNGATLLDEVSGTKSLDTSFLENDPLTFSSTDSIHVVKTFTLDLNGTAPPGITSENFATVGLIEQNAVPEPASMAALAFGGLGLLARRRRRR